jgi:16S rRNA G527 N7-methylase RsmG
VSWINEYANQITAWDKVHRLVGKSKPQRLIEESLEALNSLDPEVLSGPKLMLDVGAGSGILGIPAMQLFHVLHVLFVEPDPKKAAFIRNYVSNVQPKLQKRCWIATQRLEDVSRETVEKCGDLEPVLLARAFSGDVALEEAAQNSIFAGRHLFAFRSEGARHFFEKLC